MVVGEDETEKEGVNSLEYRAHEGVWHSVVTGFSCRGPTQVTERRECTQFRLFSASQGCSGQ
jgi:hypothetical protein